MTMEAIQTIEFNDVKSVYSGKNETCCCGCAGKHTYSSVHREQASKYRGYRVQDSEVNDRTVKMILNKLKKNFAQVEHTDNSNHRALVDHFSLVLGKRLYVVYLTLDASERLREEV